jgi:hypothetical protein
MSDSEIKKYLLFIQSFIGRPSKSVNMAPAITATPPREGLKSWWILWSPGESNNFHCVSSLINTGNSRNAIRKEMAV